MSFVVGAFRAVSGRMPFGRPAAPTEWLADDPRQFGAAMAAAGDPVPSPMSLASAAAETGSTKKAPAGGAAAKKSPAAKKSSAAKSAPTKKAPARKSPAKKSTPAAVAAQRAPEPSAAPAATAEDAPPTAVELPPVRPGEDPWTPAEVAEVVAELHRERERLLEEIADADAQLAEMRRDAGDNAVDDQADAGSRTFEREQQLSLAANTTEMLAQVDHALRRLRNGEYGRCEECGEPISKVRLQAFPRATLCLKCKERQERR